MNKKIHKPFSIAKPIVFIVLAVLQIGLYLYIIQAVIAAWNEDYNILTPVVLLVLLVLGVIPAIFATLLRQQNQSVKLSRIVFILLMPLVGAPWYDLFGNGIFGGRARSVHKKQQRKNLDFLDQNPKVLEELASRDLAAAGQAHAILNSSDFPVYTNTRTVLFQNGDDFLRIVLDEIMKAKKFIFIECGALRTGVVFNEIFGRLENKAQDEIEINIIYDKKATGSHLPRGFKQSCRGVGISCLSFGSFGTERDNRFSIIIDGNVAFSCSSSNLSDEILRGNPTMSVLRGDAVWSSTVMFLNMWDILAKENRDYSPYRPTLTYVEEQGYVAVFGASPSNRQNPIRTGYLKMISSAQSYLFLQTPTLELDTHLTHSLTLAASSGADVRIVTAGAFAGQRTRAYYQQLLESGVRIYEYQYPLSSKSLICDDISCILTTASLDYASLLNNHESATWIFGDEAVFEARDDFMALLEDSREITPKFWRKHTQGLIRTWYAILRAITPIG